MQLNKRCFKIDKPNALVKLASASVEGDMVSEAKAERKSRRWDAAPLSVQSPRLKP
jgi:hypothetical protein